ncbi:MAG TPA: hypothetical protein DEQ68_03640 [Ruminococcaceae bacterium]|nr:hypothetical protein [Oscillospiraceae bacterium]
MSCPPRLDNKNSAKITDFFVRKYEKRCENTTFFIKFKKTLDKTVSLCYNKFCLINTRRFCLS